VTLRELVLDFNPLLWKFPAVNNLSKLNKFAARNCDLKVIPDQFIGRESDSVTCKSLTEVDFSKNFLDEIPDNFKKLSGLHTLRAAHNLLEEFPTWTLEMKSIQELDLSHNRIPSLPIFFKKSLFDVVRKKKKTVALAKGLKKLNIANNCFDQFPIEIEALNKLEEFDISHNDLRDSLMDTNEEILPPNLRIVKVEQCGMTTFPQAFFKIPQLQQMHLSRNRISELPKFNNNFPYMQVLILDSCFIKDLTPIFPLKLLRTLHANNNAIRTLPALPTHSMNSLADLRLNNNRLEFVSPEIANYTALTHLELSHNFIESIDSSISNLTLLKHLDLSHNRIQSLPESSFVEMRALQKLDLSHNYDDRVEGRPALASVPPLTKCSKLRELHLNDNAIQQLPKGLERMTALTVLNASRNQINELNITLYQCVQIEDLNLSYNLISTLTVPILPEYADEEEYGHDVSNLWSLKRLNVAHNQIESLPDDLSKLEQLESLDFQGNNFDSKSPSWIAARQSLKYLDEARLPKLIVNGVYMSIGPATCANTLAFKNLGISHVLDVSICKRSRSAHLNCRKFPGITYKTFYMGSSEDIFLSEWERPSECNKDPTFVLDLWQLLDQTNQFINTAREQNGTIYIAGDENARDENAPVQLLVILSYLMHREHMTRRQALTFVRDRIGISTLQCSKKSIARLLCHLRRYGRIIQERDTDWPPIKQILYNESKRAYFRKFCQKEQSSENIGFWEEVERRYKCQSDPKKRIAIAEDIYKNFLTTESRYSLNINRKMSERVQRKLSSFNGNTTNDNNEDLNYDSDGEGNRVKQTISHVHKDGPSLDLFDSVLGVIEKVMVDTETRFRTSDLNTKMLNDTLKFGRNPQTQFLISKGDDVDSDESDQSDDEDDLTTSEFDLSSWNADELSAPERTRHKFSLDFSANSPQIERTLSARKRHNSITAPFSLRLGGSAPVASPRTLTKKNSTPHLHLDLKLR
jgi:Leucine-rich repeat (LRR) protein